MTVSMTLWFSEDPAAAAVAEASNFSVPGVSVVGLKNVLLGRSRLDSEPRRRDARPLSFLLGE